MWEAPGISASSHLFSLGSVSKGIGWYPMSGWLEHCDLYLCITSNRNVSTLQMAPATAGMASPTLSSVPYSSLLPKASVNTAAASSTPTFA